ncbi:winged helix-turn-helix transcriptional regulator [Arthrobacter sp. KNU40]|uniref:winged helix-turn-helix transcriptional regulator n=1 Tax=Arthrobacter sp. KNU40 TaxID=3447965 RepID=UPI003F627100
MKRQDQKSHCAVNFALEVIGDPWSLLIVRDIAFDGKHTFSEFLASKERIARNILASRLVQLEGNGVLAKQTSRHDRRVTLYTLTEKGIDLIPVLFELSKWSVKYDPDTAASKEFGEVYFKDPIGTTRMVQNAVRHGRAAFAGEESVVQELGMN